MSRNSLLIAHCSWLNAFHAQSESRRTRRSRIALHRRRVALRFSFIRLGGQRAECHCLLFDSGYVVNWMGHSRAIRSAETTTAATTRRIHQTNRRTIQEEAATRRASASDCGSSETRSTFCGCDSATEERFVWRIV